MKSRGFVAGLTTVLAAILAACGAAAQEQPDPAPPESEPAPDVPDAPPAAPEENYGPAPEITNEVWLNTDAPIRLADQRGKVVLVEFWTFG